jgi:antitoxin Phd
VLTEVCSMYSITTMNTVAISAKEAKNKFGALLDSARRAPVIIERNGRKVAVVLAYEDFEYMEDVLWAQRAKEAKKDGVLSKKKSEQCLNELLETV